MKMERITEMFRSILSGECRLTDSDLAKAAELLIAIATTLGNQFAHEALTSLEIIGVPVSGFTMASFAGYAARLQWEKLSAFGLTRLDKPVFHHTARAKELLKNNPHITNTDDFLNLALFRDVVAYMLRHFMPIRKLAAMLATPGMFETLSDENTIGPAPYSDAAIKCTTAARGISYASIKTRGIALEPVSIDDLLKEQSLTVNEAARVMRVAPKTLEDMCRDGRVPESVYTRYAKNGSYHFPTSKLLAFMGNGAQNSQKSRR